MIAIAMKTDRLACQAAEILREAGAEVFLVSELPQELNGHIVLTSQQAPSRFPNRYLRIEGGQVHVREHPSGERKNSNGFRVAVLDMGVKFSLLTPAPKEKKKDYRPDRWLRRRYYYPLC